MIPKDTTYIFPNTFFAKQRKSYGTMLVYGFNDMLWEQYQECDGVKLSKQNLEFLSEFLE